MKRKKKGKRIILFILSNEPAWQTWPCYNDKARGIKKIRTQYQGQPTFPSSFYCPVRRTAITVRRVRVLYKSIGRENRWKLINSSVVSRKTHDHKNRGVQTKSIKILIIISSHARARARARKTLRGRVSVALNYIRQHVLFAHANTNTHTLTTLLMSKLLHELYEIIYYIGAVSCSYKSSGTFITKISRG